MCSPWTSWPTNSSDAGGDDGADRNGERAGEDDRNGDGRRSRRRGRRGGRRNRRGGRENGDQPALEQGEGGSYASDGEGQDAVAVGRAAATDVSGGEAGVRHRHEVIEIREHEAEPVGAEPVGRREAEYRPAEPVVAHSEPASFPPADFPPIVTRRSEPEPRIAFTPSDDAPVKTPDPAAIAAAEQPAEPAAPRRSGWWQRKVF